jgi:hypothetical protein
MLCFGDYTLKYVFSEFLKGGQTDLRGHIMLAAMRDLLGGEDMGLDADTGQEWFDEWKEHAVGLLNSNSMEFMEENYPASSVLLKILETAELDTASF